MFFNISHENVIDNDLNLTEIAFDRFLNIQNNVFVVVLLVQGYLTNFVDTTFLFSFFQLIVANEVSQTPFSYIKICWL